jgi:hypothetical protein
MQDGDSDIGGVRRHVRFKGKDRQTSGSRSVGDSDDDTPDEESSRQEVRV